jgi:hypothetical protein
MHIQTELFCLPFFTADLTENTQGYCDIVSVSLPMYKRMAIKTVCKCCLFGRNYSSRFQFALHKYI